MPEVEVIIKGGFLYLLIVLFIIIGIYRHEREYKYREKDVPEETNEEFKKIYIKLYNNNMIKYEKTRKRLRIESIFKDILEILCFFVVLGSLIPILGVSKSFVVPLIIIFAIIALLIFKISGSLINYRKKYRNIIIPELTKIVDSNLIYKIKITNEAYLDKIYSKLKFKKKPYQEISSKQYVDGLVDNNKMVELFDLDVLKLDGTQEKQIICVVTSKDNKKDIDNYIKISRNYNNVMSEQTNRVDFNNLKFESYFTVHSENGNLAKRMIDEKVLNCIVEFYENTNIDFDIVIENDRKYLRFFVDNLFEPKLNEKNQKSLFIYYCILNFIIEITKKIDDNINKV